MNRPAATTNTANIIPVPTMLHLTHLFIVFSCRFLLFKNLSLKKKLPRCA
ncbi:conserved hypothetical protein [delta proteobacterium NaphS2]|nr:conserved hypothetical protein [delta proteobacterium NaphS2]